MATSTPPGRELVGYRPAESLAQFGGRPHDFHAEQQPAVNPHLLDIAEIDTVLVQHGKDTGGDPGPILPCDRQQVGKSGCHVTLTVAGRTGQAPTGGGTASSESLRCPGGA